MFLTFLFSIDFLNLLRLNNSLFDFSDKYSYCIYIVHQFFILSPFSIADVSDNFVLNWVVTMFVIFAAAIILKKISDKCSVWLVCIETRMKKILRTSM